MKKQQVVYVLSWLGAILYLISLFLPYQVMGLTNKRYTSGIEFGLPLAGFLFVLPMILVIQLSKSVVGRGINLALGILYLLFCFFCFFASIFTIFGPTPEPGIGVFLIQLTGLLFVVAVSMHLSIPQERKVANRESDLLDDYN